MHRLLATCILLASAAAARENDPAKRHEDAVRRFGSPVDAAAFHFTGVMYLDGKPQGDCAFSAEPDCLPGQQGKKDHWRVTEVTHDLEGKTRVESTAYLAKDLRAVSGKTDRDGRSVAWRRVGDDYESVDTAADGSVKKRTFAAEPYATASVAGAILFMRLAWPIEDRYTARTLLDGVKAADISWNFQGPARWCGAKAIVVSCRIGGVPTIVALHPYTRIVLGVAIRGEFSVLWCLAKGRNLVAPERDPLFDLTERNATSPVEAATQASLWLFSKDMDLGRRCIHWPTVYRKLTRLVPTEATMGVFRERYLAEARKDSPPDLPAERKKLILWQFTDGHIVMPDAHTAIVTYGDEATSMKVIEVGGIWYWLVPGADK